MQAGEIAGRREAAGEKYSLRPDGAERGTSEADLRIRPEARLADRTLRTAGPRPLVRRRDHIGLSRTPGFCSDRTLSIDSHRIAAAAAARKHPDNPARYDADRGDDRRLFHEQGFTRFATAVPRILQEDLDGKPRDVLEAVRRVLESRGLLLRCCLWEEELPKADWNDYRKRRKLLQRFFLEIPRPFAFILSSSSVLPILYRVLHDAGLRVPEEVAVLSNTDDWSVTENAFVPTSYISGEFPELGHKLVELLARMMDGEAVRRRRSTQRLLQSSRAAAPTRLPWRTSGWRRRSASSSRII